MSDDEAQKIGSTVYLVDRSEYTFGETPGQLRARILEISDEPVPFLSAKDANDRWVLINVRQIVAITEAAPDLEPEDSGQLAVPDLG